MKKAQGSDIAGAVAFVRERLGVVRKPVAPAFGTPWSELRPGTVSECARLATLRNLAPEAVQLAAARGFLHFGTLWGKPFWAITDQRRKLVEFRRLDGQPWPAYGHLVERKIHCLGRGVQSLGTRGVACLTLRSLLAQYLEIQPKNFEGVSVELR